jgi:hypothetical protein
MELPDDVLKLIREYSCPSYPYWKKGSYFCRYLKTINEDLLEQLQFWIIIKNFSYSKLNYLRIEYNLLKNSLLYRKYVNGEFRLGNYYMTGYWEPEFGPKIPRPICFPILIGNTQKILKDVYNSKEILSNRSTFILKGNIESHVAFEIRFHKEMKMRYPDRLFGYNEW